MLTANRERFERKWGIEWQPHRHRPGPAYRRLIAGIREVVREVIPAGSRVLVISKGDPDLLDLEGRDARHFPQDADGSYAGYHPAGSADAIGHLKSLATSRGRISPHPRPVALVARLLCRLLRSTSPTPARRRSARPICA